MTAVPDDPDDPALIAAKRALRAELRRRRDARPAERRGADDRARADLLLTRLELAGPACIAGYLSAGSEPGTLAIVHRLAGRGFEVLLPASRNGAWAEPAWARYSGPDELQLGPRAISEPRGDRLPAEAVARARVVLCPGLAGTARGERLGRGGGWYDRVLPLVTGTRVLLLNDDEVLEALPVGPLDARVDAIVTPTAFRECRA